VVIETIPDCRYIERLYTKITECYLNGKWTVTETKYECKTRKELNGGFSRQCWTGTTWGAPKPLQCDLYMGRTRCWDPDENGWVWENKYEVDGSIDGSPLTSIETDGLPGTSASEPLVADYEGESHGTFDHSHDVAA
jgi:hypothetical protein